MQAPAKPQKQTLGRWAAWIVLPALAAPAQYVGKVGQGIEKKQPLRATAVYEYTGSMTKPNASRLVPVVVWDGDHYQPGGLYLAQPEPLAVAPGTQYVLELTGVPAGYFNIASAGQLAGAWVGLGRFAEEQPKPPPRKLAASKKLPKLSGGAGRGRDGEDDTGSGPVLHRKAGSEGDSPSAKPSAPSNTPQASPPSDSSGPTLHRRDAPAGSSGDTSQGASTAPPVDPDRPTLHKPASPGAGGSSASSADPDRPTLHHHPEAADASTAADPDRPHLRYGQPLEQEGAVLPSPLKDLPVAGIKIGVVAAVSDVEDDMPHPFHYNWPNATAATEAEQAMHALALRALANSAQARFGPAAKENAALQQAADAAENSLRAAGARAPAPSKLKAAARPAPPSTDPLAGADFHAFELSYGGGATYVYTAHTATPGMDRRYVTVIGQPDFYGKPHAVLAQATRTDMLTQTPALRLIDAVDTDGDHRAELLFSEQTVDPGDAEGPVAAHQFAIYSVAAGVATRVYSTVPGMDQ